MKNKRDYMDFLIDISKAIKDIDFDTFVNDTQKVYATIHCLEIIGEAVKHIPEGVKNEYADIPWRNIAGMRDRLIHGYFVVDFKKVWETINYDLVPLKEAVNKILKTL
jgi:uncharacterized protein with HEPN domain